MLNKHQSRYMYPFHILVLKNNMYELSYNSELKLNWNGSLSVIPSLIRIIYKMG